MSCPSARRPATTSPSRSVFQATTALCSTARQEKVFTWSWKLRPRTAPSLPKNRKRDSACERSPLFSSCPMRRRYATSSRKRSTKAVFRARPIPASAWCRLFWRAYEPSRCRMSEGESVRAHGGDQAHHPVPSGADQVRFDRPGQDRIEAGVGGLALDLGTVAKLGVRRPPPSAGGGGWGGGGFFPKPGRAGRGWGGGGARGGRRAPPRAGA